MTAMERPYSREEYGYFLWVAFPWIYSMLLIRITSNQETLKIIMLMIIFLSGLGLWAIIEALYLNIDAQGALILFFVPLWQLVFFGLSTIPILLMRKSPHA